MPPKASPRVSVILPCRNAAATLPAALDSLLAQTLADFEILAVDDGSTDSTWDVLCAYARRDARDGRESRIRALRQPHTGVALAGNAAVEASCAPYIARMDADDLCLPRRLELQAAQLDADPTLDLVTGRVRFGGDRGTREGYAVYVDWLNTLETPEAISVNRFVEAPLANPSVMFRRAVYDCLGGARENTGAKPFPEDYEMWLRWLERGARAGKVPEEILIWNDPATRLSRTHEAYSLDAFARIKAQYLWRWLMENNPQHPRVWVWGAGRVSRQKLAHLLEMGLEIESYVDIDPSKIGQSVHGVPVLPREAVPAYSVDAPFLLTNVGSRGAREEIAAWLLAQGYQAGVGFVAVG